MKHADFHIGLEFQASAGLRWRCTDVGRRTTLAIQLDRDDPHWYQGPPNIAKEVAFDEEEIADCRLTYIDAIDFAIDDDEASGYMGYPSEAVGRMLDHGLGVLKSGTSGTDAVKMAV